MDVVDAGVAEADAGPACEPLLCGSGDCGKKPDGCGGFRLCSPTCGDGLWMTCEAGVCACWALPKQGAYLPAYSACTAAEPGTGAFFCGAPSDDIPAGCEAAGLVVFGTPAWCCPV